MNNLKDLSFLIYGLGLTGKSVVNFFNKNRFKNYNVWDDTNKSSYNKKRPSNLNKALKELFRIPSRNNPFFWKKNQLFTDITITAYDINNAPVLPL